MQVIVVYFEHVKNIYIYSDTHVFLENTCTSRQEGVKLNNRRSAKTRFSGGVTVSYSFIFRECCNLFQIYRAQNQIAPLPTSASQLLSIHTVCSHMGNSLFYLLFTFSFLISQAFSVSVLIS